MNLSKELIAPVIETHAKIATEENRKWVISFYPKTADWTMTDMKDMISMFQSMGYKEDVYEEQLDVFQDTDMTLYRVTGIHNISSYCQYENPKTSKGTWYRYAHVEEENGMQMPDIFSLRIVSTIEEEKPLGEMETPQSWDGSMKTYTLQKRIIYTDIATGVRYGLSMVKKSTQQALTMVLSGVSGLAPVIEYFVEIPPKLKTEEVMVPIVRMLQFIEKNKAPITLDQQKQVLFNYDALVDKVRDKKYFRDSYFLAPKPCTLEQIHISDPGLTYGQRTVLEGYAVTDKADGERMLLYIDDKGDAYFINSAFEVRSTGMKARKDVVYNTLLDGEYLTPEKRLDGVARDLFAVFDVYFVGGESVMGLPLVYIPPKVAPSTPAVPALPAERTTSAKEPMRPKIIGRSRVDIMASVLEAHLWEHEHKETSLQVIAKRHVTAYGMEMFKACAEILTQATKKGAMYDIDGLIFTPVDLPVLGFYPGKAITIKSSSSSWDRVLKWKPPEQNSIDFCVAVDKTPITDIRKKQRYAKVLLSCGYSALKNEEVSVARGLQLLQTRISERNLKEDYILKSFTPQYRYERGMEYAYIPYSADGTIKAENGDEIQDGAIVEFSYDLTDRRPVSYHWHALRVRNDKMRQIVNPIPDTPPKKGRLQIKTNKANDWKTATSIWKTIHEPITREMITGATRAPQLVQQAVNLQARLLGTDASYYGRNVTREHLLSVEMLNFHNSVIKDNLYKWSLPFPKNNLLELACGMAGDMNRWQDPVTGFSFRNILGVDLVRDNITKAVDGAYARVLKPRYGVPRKHQNYVFVIGDCAKPLHTGEAAKGLDKDSEDVLMELYGKRTTRRLLTSIPPFAKGKQTFDMVSCQFAIHYFFEKEEKLRGFLSNVRDNLRTGGVFIATFMDGASVEKLIREKGKNGLVEGRKLDDKVVVWAIRRILQDAAGNEIPQEELEEAPEASLSESEEEQTDSDTVSEADIDIESMKGGAGSRRITKLRGYEPDTKILKDYQLINVPPEGDCMFISLEIGAFGQEKSSNKDGMWMRTQIMQKMREILEKKDQVATTLYEELRMHIDNGMTSSEKEDAVRDVKRPLYSNSSDEDKTYAEKAEGYIEWMSKKGVWGTEIELRIAVDTLERPIYIYQTDAKTKIAQAHAIGQDKFAGKQPVRIWYNGTNHYKAVVDMLTPIKALVPTAALPPIAPGTPAAAAAAAAASVASSTSSDASGSTIAASSVGIMMPLPRANLPPIKGRVTLPPIAPRPLGQPISVASIAPVAPVVPIVASSTLLPSPVPELSRFGRLIDVYLENTNRLIPEYLVDFNLLNEYATQYGLELEQDGMFSDTYQAYKNKNPAKNSFPNFDKDLIQQQFSFLNRWVVFKRV